MVAKRHPGRAPATAAANGGLDNAIHDLVLGYQPAASAQPKLRAPTASNNFESAGRKRRAEATAAIIQRLIAGKAAGPKSRGRSPASVSDRNIREQICATATGGPLCHRYVTERCHRAGPWPQPPITRNFGLWALIEDSHYVVNYKK